MKRKEKYVRPCCRHNAQLLLQGPPHISEDTVISPRYKEVLRIATPENKIDFTPIEIPEPEPIVVVIPEK